MLHPSPFLADLHWLVDYRLRADVPPSVERVALTVAGQACGSVELTLARSMLAERLPIHRQGDSLALDTPTDDAFAAIARWLHGQGHGGKWRDELLSVTNDAGDVLAAVERAAVRPLGIATRAAHLVGGTADGRTWVQRRALDKSVDPGLLDTLVGGLCAHGESLDEALSRETWEEAGLKLAQLQAIRPLGHLVVRRPLSDGYMVERIEMFAALVPHGMAPQNQDGEAMGFELVNAGELLCGMRAGLYTFEATLIHAHWLQHTGELSP